MNVMRGNPPPLLTHQPGRQGLRRWRHDKSTTWRNDGYPLFCRVMRSEGARILRIMAIDARRHPVAGELLTDGRLAKGIRRAK